MKNALCKKPMNANEFSLKIKDLKKGDMVYIKVTDPIYCHVWGDKWEYQTEFYQAVLDFENTVCYPQHNYRGQYWSPAERQFDDLNDIPAPYKYLGNIKIKIDSNGGLVERTQRIRYNEIEELIIIPKKAARWLQAATDHANLNSDCDDCIWIAINKYKALRELDAQQKDFIYDSIASSLGFTN